MKYVVMLFKTAMELGTEDKPNVWVNTANVYFSNPSEALTFYAETPCPASQFIEAEDDYALQCKIGEMILNYNNDQWLNKNLYPYI